MNRTAARVLENGGPRQSESLMPSHEVVDVLGYLTSRYRALVLGPQTADPLFLATRGVQTTVVVDSAAALTRLTRLAERSGVEVKGIRASLEDFRISRRYDLISARRSLQSLEPQRCIALIWEMQKQTRPRGFNLVEVEVPRRAGDPAAAPLAEGELLALYQGWRVLTWQTYTEQPPGRERGVNRIVAQRP